MRDLPNTQDGDNTPIFDYNSILLWLGISVVLAIALSFFIIDRIDSSIRLWFLVHRTSIIIARRRTTRRI
jgi:hypothetical protein